MPACKAMISSRGFPSITRPLGLRSEREPSGEGPRASRLRGEHTRPSQHPAGSGSRRSSPPWTGSVLIVAHPQFGPRVAVLRPILPERDRTTVGSIFDRLLEDL